MLKTDYIMPFGKLFPLPTFIDELSDTTCYYYSYAMYVLIVIYYTLLIHVYIFRRDR